MIFKVTDNKNQCLQKKLIFCDAKTHTLFLEHIVIATEGNMERL